MDDPVVIGPASNRRSAPGTVPESGEEPRRLEPRTWLMIAFGVSIPLFFVTAWAAVTSNWLVLAPVFVVICGGELWFLWRQMRDS